jgi:hypothetical protein
MVLAGPRMLRQSQLHRWCSNLQRWLLSISSNDGAKLNGGEYPSHTCTWEPGPWCTRGEGIQPRCTVPGWHSTVVESTSATAKRSNERNVTEYDTTKERFKLVGEGGEELWENSHKPDKNHSWTVAGFGEDQPATSGDESSDKGRAVR